MQINHDLQPHHQMCASNEQYAEIVGGKDEINHELRAPLPNVFSKRLQLITRREGNVLDKKHVNPKIQTPTSML